MKRIFSILLALTLMLALAVPAFAADTTTYQDFNTNPQTGSKDVTASYATAATPDPGTTYYFTITWEANAGSNLTFTRGTDGYKWDGASMKYVADSDKNVKDKWSGSAGYKVTVTNQSNTSVFVKTSTTNTYGLNLTGSDLNQELTTAAVKGGTAITVGDTMTQGTKQEAETTYTYAAQDGATSPAADVTTSFKVGTITVKVSKNTIA